MWLMFAMMAAGTVAGGVFSYSMDMRSPKELVQGALGGLIAATLIGLMLPK